MVYSISEDKKRHSIKLKSTNEMTLRRSLKLKNIDEISSKDVNLHSDNSKQYTTKSIINIRSPSGGESHDSSSKNRVNEDNIFQLCKLKLNIKRIDETNYVSILSSHSLKNTSSKSLQWSERNKSDIPKLAEKLMHDSDNEEENCQPNKQFRRISVASYSNESDDSTDDTLESIVPKRILRTSVTSTSSKSNKMFNSLEFDSPKRRRKPVDRFGDLVDLNETVIMNTPSKSKLTRKKSVSSTTSKKSTNMKHERKPVDQFCESVDLSKAEIENTPTKRTRKISLSLPISVKSNTSSKSLRWVEHNKNDNTSKLVEELMNDSDNGEKSLKSNKQFRRISVGSYSNESDDSTDDTLESIVPKRSLRTSVSTTPSKSSKRISILEFDTPKRERKPVDRFGDSVDFDAMEIGNTPSKRTRRSVSRYGESMDLNNVEDMNTPRSNKKPRSGFINDDNDKDFEVDEWTTPKRLRLSMTPTLRSGSKVRRSILHDISENKEIEVASTPKTPKKTPKAHVKNLIASASRRSDSGARVPCSPLEKARANLHLHAAPKHLPCREVEFKSIHSFLARKISDELTGSMYISGVPGTGKTATVKRVIDSLNSDIIMKHSFKFIEINGLRLANPHQAFSVIWKELSKETVSSSRAQALLNDFFSGKKIRKLSTILLVDEVDHICNRKQDVVYNILDWPSHTGSKVVVITIANTMDLPERVLRGCVTSRMGLTRLVFKPYTFQQLQEIIMNRLIGNSSFDPDAVQLVARKVAAVSGDARRALDVCRRAIDLIKSEDESQLITINHVNQVLNSILSGVRVTAIRQCSLLEQFFLKALRDETTRTGFDHSTIDSIYTQMKSICLLEGEELPNDQQVIMMAYRLRDSGLIFLEKKRSDIFRKVSLNVSPEDISYALDKYNI